MAVTKFIESGSAATQGFEFWPSFNGTASTGTLTSDAQSVLGSARSIKISTGASADGFAAVSKQGIMADAGRRFSMGVRFHGTPTPATNAAEFISIINNGGGVLVFMIALDASMKINLITDNHTVLATGSVALSQDTDYRLLCVYTITSTTVNSITVKIFDSSNNLVDTITVTNGTLQFTGGDTMDFALRDNGFNAGANFTVYGAHFYVDDGTSGDPGNIRVTAKRPISNGTSIQFITQIGAGGSGVGTGHAPQVNERPLSQTNGWSLSNTTKATEEYNIEGIAAGDNDLTGATIVDYTGWIFSNVNSIANTPAHHIIVNGVATTITESVTAGLFTQIAGSSTYPAGTGSDIGMDAQFATAHLTRLFEAGILVAYIPAVGGAAVPATLPMMGIGS